MLSSHDPDPVMLLNAAGRSPFLLTGDHAGNDIPATLGTLGLAGPDRVRHIAWDIGVMAVGALLAEQLDAAFLAQRYSRLVIDCNRDPLSPDAMPAESDGTAIPGNRDLDADHRQARIAGIHRPYQTAIADIIAARRAGDRPTIMIALHSFTPSMAGFARPWHVGVLHAGGRTDFAQALLAVLARDRDLAVGDNEPYRMDATDHSVPRHAFDARLPYAEIEMRQDLIGDAAGQARWGALLAEALRAAAAEIGF